MVKIAFRVILLNTMKKNSKKCGVYSHHILTMMIDGY